MTPTPSRICLGCWQQLKLPVPLHGPLSAPFRLFGVRPSRMNPNTCTICEMAFSRIMKARSVTTDATVFFADLRGYTVLSQSWPSERLSELLDVFYDECATAIWRYDGLLNKTMGDAVLAIFNFPIRQPDHAVQALLAAREIQHSFRKRQAELRHGMNDDDAGVGIGIGIDSGDTNFGEFGHSHRDLTAIGTVVNRAARAQAVARPGEILVTDTVRSRAEALVTSAGQDYALKGFVAPVTLFAA
ncbi:MAG: adenylate/guanylate cyclase domain-containing protein [Afipia sp.]